MKIIFVKTKGFNTKKTHNELVYVTCSFQFLRDKLTNNDFISVMFVCVPPKSYSTLSIFTMGDIWSEAYSGGRNI